MAQTEMQWSVTEKKIAETVLKAAYDREVYGLIQSIKVSAAKMSKPEEAWELHDFLSAKRHDIDGKYDNRESFLMFTLSALIKDGLLERSEIEGLTPDKQAKIMLLSRM